MESFLNFFGGCEECKKWKEEKTALLKVSFRCSCKGIRYQRRILQKVKSLEKELSEMKERHRGTLKRDAASELEPVVQPKRSAKAESVSMKYCTENDKFSDKFGYMQIRGGASQDNVQVAINHQMLEVQGSHGHACLCCSVSFHLSLMVRPTLKPELFTPLHIDHITMRGKQRFFLSDFSSKFFFFSS